MLPILAAMAPEYMTEPLDETTSGTIDYDALDRVLEIQADVIAVGPGSAGAGRAAFVQSASSSERACRSSSTPTRSTRSSASPIASSDATDST